MINTTQHNTTQHNTFFKRLIFMVAVYISVYGVQAQWITGPSELISNKTNLMIAPTGGFIYFGNGSVAGNSFINLNKLSSNHGFGIILNGANRFQIYPNESTNFGTDIENQGNSIVKIGNVSNNTNIFLYGKVQPNYLSFLDNTTLNSANFLTSITGNSNRIGTITMQITTLSSGLVALQNSLNATNSGLNLRINNLEVLTNNQFATVITSLNGLNTQLNSQNTSITGLNTQFASVNTQLNSQNTSISGLNSQFTSVNSQLNSQNTSISGLNSQFASVNTQLNSQNTSILGLNSQFSSLNSQLNSQNVSISGLNSQFSILNSSLSNSWQTKSTGLYYCGNTSICGNTDINGGTIRLGGPMPNPPIYRHCFNYQYNNNGTIITVFATCQENTDPNFTMSGLVLGSRTVLTQQPFATISNNSTGITLAHNVNNPVIITPQGNMKFKDNSEIGPGSSLFRDVAESKIKTQNIFSRILGTNTLIGIGTSQPIAHLHVNGIFRARSATIENLSGTGIRMLVADATGRISSQALPIAGVLLTDFSAFQTANTTRINTLETSTNNKLATLETNTNNSINAVRDRNLIVLGGGNSGESIERLNNEIILRTNSQERLKIENGGDVRINGKLFVGGSEIKSNMAWNANDALLKERTVVQSPNNPTTGYVRAMFSNNLNYNVSTTKYELLGGSSYNDFAAIQMKNEGSIEFYNRNFDASKSDFTPTELESFRRLTIATDGNIGVGMAATKQPTAPFQIYPKNTTTRTTYFKIGENYESNIGSTHLEMGLTQTTNGEPFIQGNAKHGVPNSFGNLRLQPISGAVVIGTQTPTVSDYKLAVDGTIRAKGVIVKSTVWADYVLKSDYKLPSLVEVEQFIKQNEHLKDIPSEATVKADGIDVAEMNTLLLKKIEELTLYIIAQEKRIGKLEKK